MKLLDVVGTGAKAVKAAVAAVVAPAPRPSRMAKEELERRAQINAQAEAERARRARILDEALADRPSWLGPRRRHWLR
jgi:hypothetical protein